MQSGWNQIKQSAKEYRVDVHAVASAFLGEHGWKFLSQELKPAEGQQRNVTRWDLFTAEMMDGAQYYSNDSDVCDRVFLGLSAGLYTVAFYFHGRLIYDGVLNSIEYGAWRITGQARSPFHPDGRKRNGYVLGTPVSMPFIAAMAGAETVIRVAGFSSYGWNVLKKGHYVARNIMSRYLISEEPQVEQKEKPPQIAEETLSAEQNAAEGLPKRLRVDTDIGNDASNREIKVADVEAKPIADAQGILTCPRNITELLDRGALATMPSVLALAEIGLATGLTATLGILEVAGRVAGISEYDGRVMRLGFNHMRDMSQYTKSLFGPGDEAQLVADAKAIMTCPRNGWEAADRVGVMTGGAVVLVTELGIGIAVTTVGGVSEVVYYTLEGVARVVGVSQYGAEVIKAGHHASSAMMASYFNRRKTAEEEIADVPVRKSSKDAAGDAKAEALLPAQMGEDLPVAANTQVDVEKGEANKQVVIANKAHQEDLPQVEAKSITIAKPADEYSIFTCPRNVRDLLDRGALFTIPSAIALTEMSLTASLMVVFGSVEFAGRLVGISKYDGHVIRAGFNHMRAMSKYTEGLFGPKDSQQLAADAKAIMTCPRSGWEVADRVGAATGGTVVLMTELGIGIAVTTIGGVGEGVFRFLGFSEYGLTVIEAGHRASSVITSRYFGGSKAPAPEEKGLTSIFSCPKDIAGGFDRGALVTLPAAVALSEMSGAVALTGILGGVEITGRVLGISQYNGHFIRACFNLMRGMSVYTEALFGHRNNEQLTTDEAAIRPAPRNGWGFADRVGMMTGGAVVAVTEFGVGVAVTVTGGVGESVFRFLGFSEYGLGVIEAGHHASTAITARYFGGSKAKEEKEQASVHKPSKDSTDEKGQAFLANQVSETFEILPATVNIVKGDIIRDVATVGAEKQSLPVVEAKPVVRNPSVDKPSIFSCPKNIKGAFDRGALVTLPAAVALTEMSGAVALTVVFGGVEIVGRMLGISEYNGQVIRAGFNRMRGMSVYTEGLFGSSNVDQLAVDQRNILTCPQDGWGLADRFGTVTGGTVIVAAEFGVGVAVTITGGIGEGIFRVLGFSEYGGEVIKAGHHASSAMMASYFNRRKTAEEEIANAPVQKSSKGVESDAKAEALLPAQMGEDLPVAANIQVDIEKGEANKQVVAANKTRQEDVPQVEAKSIAIAEPADEYSIFTCPRNVRDLLEGVFLFVLLEVPH